MGMSFQNPSRDCDLCPRLAAFRQDNRAKFPDKFNAPVPSFGKEDCELLIAGLAPGLKGANFTGRPFTGDYAGDLLYATLLKFGWAEGVYDRRADDGLILKNCRITNAVRCVPPENKPTTQEINTCRSFLIEEINSLPNLKVIIALGLVSHNAVLKTFEKKLSAHKFAHGAQHDLDKPVSMLSPRKREPSGSGNQDPRLRGGGSVVVIDSYHCSRYNTQTGRLSAEMFEDIFEQAGRIISQK